MVALLLPKVTTWGSLFYIWLRSYPKGDYFISFTTCTTPPTMMLKGLQIYRVITEQSGLGAQVWMCWCYHIHWPSLNTMNSIFPSKLPLSHHANMKFCSLGQHRAMPLQHLTLVYKGFLQQAIPVWWRQRRKFKLATSALKLSNPIRNLCLCSALCCLQTDSKSSFDQWWAEQSTKIYMHCKTAGTN